MNKTFISVICLLAIWLGPSWAKSCCSEGTALTAYHPLDADLEAAFAEVTGPYDKVEFETPRPEEAAAYLGLSPERKKFTLEDIKFPVLVVEIFTTSCPHCQHDAKNFNAIYDLILQKGLQDKIKIIGIGMSNSNPEIDAYRKKFGVSFPLISDRDNAAYRFVGRVQIPFFMVLKRTETGQLKKVYEKSREKRKPDDVLKTIVSSSGIE